MVNGMLALARDNGMLVLAIDNCMLVLDINYSMLVLAVDKYYALTFYTLLNYTMPY
jgi:hypothetical protein